MNIHPDNVIHDAGGIKATIYTKSEFFGHIVATEIKLVSHGRRPYAQYPSVPFATFVPRGKRNARGWQGSYRPYCLILRGWGHPVPPDPFGPETTTPGGLPVSRTRHRSFDSSWVAEFEAMIGPHLATADVIADYRDRAGLAADARDDAEDEAVAEAC